MSTKGKVAVVVFYILLGALFIRLVTLNGESSGAGEGESEPAFIAMEHPREYDRELKQEHMEILKDFFHTEKANIYYESHYLYQLDYAQEYLKEKYPSYDLRIVGGAVQNKDDNYAVFKFLPREEYESTDKFYWKTYRVYVYAEDIRHYPYKAEDNFYIVFIKDDYERIMKEKLREIAPECEEVILSRVRPQGKDFAEGLTAEMFLNEKKGAGHTLWIKCVAPDMTEKDYRELKKKYQRQDGRRGY
ncbi:MAG: hypothetical protein IJR00_07240 [Lachnospiraceae bacterium]|nr:hypothetical protein [Lachnospiraceae bacterium]